MVNCIKSGLTPAQRPQGFVPDPRPYRCPVCGGNGLVSQGFYRTTTGIAMAASTEPEQCRTCGGRGMVVA